MKNPRNCRTGLPTCTVASSAVSTSYPAAERGLDAALEHGIGHAGFALHVDASSDGPASNTRCAVARSNAAKVTAPKSSVLTEAEEADDAELLRRAAQQDADAVADREAVLARGRRVHRHLVRGPRGA